MKTNKGVIGIGLVLAIVLGVAVVGGGAYYLGTKEKGYKSEDDYGFMFERLKETNPELGQKLPAVEDKKTPEISSECNRNSPSSIKLISPNGGEVYTAGQKITVKWESCNVEKNSISFFLLKHDISKPYQQSEMYSISSSLGGSNPYVLEANDGISEFTLPDFTNKDLIVGQRYFIGISGSGDAINIGSGYVPGDYSDGLFTINPGEESSIESFKDQLGVIKSIKADGDNKWILAVDLLSRNSKWTPGDDKESFFLNQNTKIRNLNVTSSIETYTCGESPTNGAFGAFILSNTINTIKKIQPEDIKYFDINGTNITTIYEQCLP